MSDYIPGVPAAGHVTRGGYWHPGSKANCAKCAPPEARRHDYEPGEGRHPMSTDPNCRVCGQSERGGNHR